MTRIVILAAGKGTRMDSNLPKVLVSLQQRPIISYLMDSVIESKVDPNPILVVSLDNLEIIRQTLKNYQVEYVIQKKQLGTADAVSCTREAINRSKNRVDKIIVLYGDHPFLKAESIKALSEINNKVITIMPTKLADFNNWRSVFYYWGRVIRNKQDLVEKIVEFKDTREKDKLIIEVNSGFMSFNKDWLFNNIDNLSRKNSQHEYYLTDLVQMAASSVKKIGTINIDAQEAIGINNPEELKIASRLFNI